MGAIVTPRFVIAATGSGIGKTTVTLALLAAFRNWGLKVAAFKCGPDYLDPGYHQRASGGVSPNLDGWMMGRKGVLATFAHASDGADIAVIEGMMGLYDSAAPTSDEGSTAEIARWLDAPIVLVLDASGIARTVGALALGFAGFDPSIRVGGLICNRIAGRGHLDLLRAACPVVPILGGLPTTPQVGLPERHLGLVSALSSGLPDALFRELGKLATEWLDLDQILTLAKTASSQSFIERPVSQVAPRCRIGVAYDEAFHFYYGYNLAALEQSGAELVRFSPIRDRALPPMDGLYFGGGYPEVAARELAQNRSMIEAIRDFATAGGPVYAECGGLMYLAEGIRTLDGNTIPMVGLIPGVSAMHEKIQALGYVEVETTAASFLGPAGSRWRGHQFRYSTLEPATSGVEQIYRVAPRWGSGPFAEGLRPSENVIASYVHAHWASNIEIPQNFTRACADHRRRPNTYRNL